MTAKPRRRWFQLSLRTLFVLTAVFAITLMQWKRRERLIDEGLRHRGEQINIHVRNGSAWESPSTDEKQFIRQVYEYHNAMCKKYWKAIWQPWVELLPDPLPPEPHTLTDAAAETSPASLAQP